MKFEDMTVREIMAQIWNVIGQIAPYFTVGALWAGFQQIVGNPGSRLELLGLYEIFWGMIGVGVVSFTLKSKALRLYFTLIATAWNGILCSIYFIAARFTHSPTYGLFFFGMLFTACFFALFTAVNIYVLYKEKE